MRRQVDGVGEGIGERERKGGRDIGGGGGGGGREMVKDGKILGAD